MKRLARIWTIVYTGNFIGALLVAYLFRYETHMVSTDPWLSAAKKIGEVKTSHFFLATFIRGISANWLVCMAVWMAYAAKDVTGKIPAMWFPVMYLVTFGFEHSIANMFFIPLSMPLGAPISMDPFLVGNLVPATLGNIAGGVVFLAFAYRFIFGKGSMPAGEKKTATNFGQNKMGVLEKHLN